MNTNNDTIKKKKGRRRKPSSKGSATPSYATNQRSNKGKKGAQGCAGMHAAKEGPQSKRARGSVLQAMKQRLQGGHFRWLNEKLYTTSGDDAFRLMKSDPNLYERYHDGFREQTKSWPERPVDVAIHWLKRKPPTWSVVDLGCGDAELAKTVRQKVYSFDLVANNVEVIACNMNNLPLKSSTVDAAVFCLSLMGTDYGSFIQEAARVLKTTGWLWVAEVQSRFIDQSGSSVLEDFISAVKGLGFELRRKDTKNSHFLILEFQGKSSRDNEKRLTNAFVSWPFLRACQYKPR